MIRIKRKTFVRLVFFTPLLLLAITSVRAVLAFNFWQTRGYEWYLEEGIELKAEGRITEAYSNLKEAESLNPEGFRVNYEIGELLFKRGVLEGESSAQEYLERSLELSIDQANFTRLQDYTISYLSQIYLVQNDIDRAITIIDTYDDQARGSIFFSAKGRVYLHQADPAQFRAGTFDVSAIAYEEAYERAESEDERNRLKLTAAYVNMPNNLAASQNLVDELVSNLADNQTSSVFRNAVELRGIITDNALAGGDAQSFDDQLRARILRNTEFGIFFLEQEYPRIALHFLNKSESEVSSVGNNAPVFVKGATAQSFAYRGTALMQLERYSEAESSFRFAYNFQPFNHQYLYLVGLNQFSDTSSDRLDDALRTFEEVYNKNYRAENFLETYTDALIESGQLDLALDISEECYQINPANTECLQDYTELATEAGAQEVTDQILSDLSVTFEYDTEVSGFFTAKIGYLTNNKDTETIENILLALEESESEFAQEVRVYTYFYLSRIYQDSNRDKYIDYIIKTVDLDSEGRFPEAQEELQSTDIPDRTQGFWWWVDELI